MVAPAHDWNALDENARGLKLAPSRCDCLMIEFADNWYKPPLARLNDPLFISHLWVAKARMALNTPTQISDLKKTVATLTAKKTAPGGKLTGKEAETLEEAEKKLNALTSGSERGKVNSTIAKTSAGYTPNDFRTATEVTDKKTINAREMDRRLEQIHNDRLRMSDLYMLKTYTALDIRKAIFEAAPSFKSNARVAKFFATAIASTGKPVVITQGVHQKDDPHFDVRMPDEAQQMHVNVELDPDAEQKMTITSVSFMNGAGKNATKTTVTRDGAAVLAT